jgi:hypothetical protein
MPGRSAIFIVLDRWVPDCWLAVVAQATASQSVDHTLKRRSDAKSQAAGGQPDGIVLGRMDASAEVLLAPQWPQRQIKRQRQHARR